MDHKEHFLVKNTTGGILNIIRTPVSLDEMGVDLKLTGGEYGRQDVSAVAQLPLFKILLGSNYLPLKLSMMDTSVTPLGTKTLVETIKQTLVLQHFGQPNDNFDLKVHYESWKIQSVQGAYVNRTSVGELACTITQIGFDPANGCEKDANDGPDTTESDGANFSDNEYETTIITANYDTDAFLYTYIYSLRDMDEENMQDFDGAPAHLLRMNFFNEWEQTSHEFRITSQFSDKVQFIAGVYDWEADFEQRWDVYDLFYQLSRLGVPPWGAGRQGVAGYSDVDKWEDDVAGNNGQAQVTSSIAVFASADWYVNDQWTLTAGFRWTEEKKDFVGGASAPGYYPLRGEPWPGVFNPTYAKAKWNETTQNSGLDTRPQITPCTMALIAKALRVVVFLPDKLIMTSTLHTNRNMLRITSSGGRPHC